MNALAAAVNFQLELPAGVIRVVPVLVREGAAGTTPADTPVTNGFLNLVNAIFEAAEPAPPVSGTNLDVTESLSPDVPLSAFLQARTSFGRSLKPSSVKQASAAKPLPAAGPIRQGTGARDNSKDPGQSARSLAPPAVVSPAIAVPAPPEAIPGSGIPHLGAATGHLLPASDAPAPRAFERLSAGSVDHPPPALSASSGEIPPTIRREPDSGVPEANFPSTTSPLESQAEHLAPGKTADPAPFEVPVPALPAGQSPAAHTQSPKQSVSSLRTPAANPPRESVHGDLAPVAQPGLQQDVQQNSGQAPGKEDRSSVEFRNQTSIQDEAPPSATIQVPLDPSGGDVAAPPVLAAPVAFRANLTPQASLKSETSEHGGTGHSTAGPLKPAQEETASKPEIATRAKEPEADPPRSGSADAKTKPAPPDRAGDPSLRVAAAAAPGMPTQRSGALPLSVEPHFLSDQASASTKEAASATPFRAGDAIRTSESAQPSPPPAGPAVAQDIAVRIAGPNAPAVDLHVVQRSGQLQVAVRTPDPALQTTLRQDLGTLVNSMERAGYHAETFTPTPVAKTAAPEMNSQDSRQDSKSGSSGRDTGGSGSQQQQRHGGQQHPESQSEAWQTELEKQS